VQRVFQIGISGSYGGMNLGDEAILDGIISQLRASLPVEITVFTRNPADTLSRHKVERAVPVRELTRKEITPEIRRLDLFILAARAGLRETPRTCARAATDRERNSSGARQ
jgi:polysaccharide pyruvyl transferase WcaK-like protein